MSKRFQRWVETWIEENVDPQFNTDIESHEARAQRLTKKLLADGAAAGFSKFEIEEERERVPRLIHAAGSNTTDFDIETYKLAWMLAMEHPDGD